MSSLIHVSLAFPVVCFSLYWCPSVLGDKLFSSYLQTWPIHLNLLLLIASNAGCNHHSDHNTEKARRVSLAFSQWFTAHPSHNIHFCPSNLFFFCIRCLRFILMNYATADTSNFQLFVEILSSQRVTQFTKSVPRTFISLVSNHHWTRACNSSLRSLRLT